MAPIRFYNTLSQKKEPFEPIESGAVRMYNCGPTVYGVQHIGNLSMFVFTDLLRRTLEYAGFEVKQVTNITDFGHLTSDADEGEDKMTKGLKRDGLPLTLENMRTMAEKYATIFLQDITTLNVRTEGTQFPRASDYIAAQIKIIETLEKKGHAYRGEGGVYFDTSTFPDYGKLGNINLNSLKEGARVALNAEKRNPTDFLLWKSDAHLGWDSPWGKGFPGWHIECSAMIKETLGEQIDIHTGGIEHIPVHHNNEIAQSESATGKKPFSRFWLHRAHLQLEGGKMAKSEGNVVYLSDIIEKRIAPLSFRYLLFGSHYRQPSNFTFESLLGAENALEGIYRMFATLPEGGTPDKDSVEKFKMFINDDLNTPQALALLHEVLKSDIDAGIKRATLVEFDKVLGLKLVEESAKYGYLPDHEIPTAVKNLLAEREVARQHKNWDRADQLRSEISELGFSVEDADRGPKILRR